MLKGLVMPIDPYFSSAFKYSPKRPRKVSKKFLLNPDTVFRRKLREEKKKGHPIFVTGGPSLTGFRPPKKVWDEKRITHAT
jgi:hypothetical protein